MMKRLTALIRIRIEDPDPETLDEIREAAEPHDDDDGLARYLGDRLCEAEDALNMTLPSGFSVKIDGVEEVDVA